MPPHGPHHTPGDPGDSQRSWASESERVSREVRDYLAGLKPRDSRREWARDTTRDAGQDTGPGHDEREQG